MSRTVQKWGNSLGVRIPKEIADRINLNEGSEVEFRLEDGNLILEPLKDQFDLDELINNITDDNRHEEHDTGRLGKEVW